MKNIFKLLLLATGILFMYSSCKKVDELPFYSNGKAPVLSSSSTDIKPTPADSNKVVASFSWTNPEYATDSSTQKFVLEIDSAGRNFSKSTSRIAVGKPSISFTGVQLNNILADFGFTPGQTFSFDIRVTSSYGNNNEQLKSNVIKVNITSYLVPITLTPSSSQALVLLVANATSTAVSFNWNASPYGANTISYALQIDTSATFANPQVIKYGTVLTSSMLVNDLNTIAISAGIIGGTTKNLRFRIVSYLGTGYTTPLVYSNAVPISITTFTPIPANLYIVGDATPLGWNNDLGLSPTQQFTKISAVSYGIIVPLKATGSYVFVPVAGNWDHKFGGASATGGPLLADNAVPGSNTPGPGTAGLYQIIVNFQTGTYTVTPYAGTIPTNLYIIGGATPLGWNNDAGLAPKQQFTRLDAVSYGIIVDLKANDSYLLLPVAGSWDHKFGGASAAGGTLLADNAVPGANTPSPATAGTYRIVVNFQTNTYTVTPYNGVTIPDNLYIVGDATAGGWNNPVPVPSQKFTQTSNAVFELVIPLAGTGSYVFLPLNGNWDHKFGGTSATGGPILADGAVPGSNTPGPTVAGNYKITVNFYTNTYTVVK
ncbi:MAG: SusF/SusE family outer membrane protein [Ferruginibacter sp.]|nr:SusF/SusE family outer membrane protein [Ferruginibacter sp.]